MKYLFVCSAGQNRSPTASNLVQQIAEERNLEIESDYIGINRATTPKRLRELIQSRATSSMIEQAVKDAAQDKNKIGRADKIFVMEDWMTKEIKEHYNPDAKIVCLDIIDIYEQNDPKLIQTLKEKLDPYL